MAGGKEDVKLLSFWPSPFGMRVQFALNLKKVTHEFIEASPLQKDEILLKHNPIYNRIPILVHGDCKIYESMIIVEYIDNVWKDSGPAIMPSDPYDVAMARFWAMFIDDKIFSRLKSVAAAEALADGLAEAEQLLEALKSLEGALEEKWIKLGKEAFFGGDRIGYLDVALGGFVSWLRAAGLMLGMDFFDEERTPILAGWVERFCAEEAVKEVMPETTKMVDFLENVLIKVMKGHPPAPNPPSGQ